eukprot:TRINITY_DN12183_c0_g1_i1.p1 TRINITY_DN12183_c0_g1~~TRINITY_DN12183_c0_g1_i1.p1  ORF type:complete len:479 (+),score=102.15 TRINITY_DN12183_c0_g1_i1:177-1613(+)
MLKGGSQARSFFRTMASRSRDFSKVLEAIDSLIPKTSAKPLGPSPAQMSNADAMAFGMKKLGITEKQLKELNVIHIAGTKGKGSTASMCESILRHHGLKTAMFTSPHLISVTERVRINGMPVSEETFATHFWSVWDKLREDESSEMEEVPKTTFFRFMTLVALHCFTHEDIDVAVIEVGMGGRLDATNSIPAPVVCGITHIGLDHVEVLGNTLSLIAAEKAGICKKDIPCLIAPGQHPEAQEQLVTSATKAGAPHVTCPSFSEYSGDAKVGLEGVHQLDNASLAVGLCHTWLQLKKEGKSSIPSFPFTLTDAFKSGLAETRWDGRCQTIQVNDKLRVMIDGAHTDQSMKVAVNWFREKAAPEREKRLVFFCQQRDVEQLLSVFKDVSIFKKAHFTPLLSSKGSIHASNVVSSEALEWVQKQCDVWKAMVPSVEAVVCSSLPSVIDELSNTTEEMDVLFTGSLYLAGDVLKAFKSKATA